jgi:hypothetical protein
LNFFTDFPALSREAVIARIRAVAQSVDHGATMHYPHPFLIRTGMHECDIDQKRAQPT